MDGARTRWDLRTEGKTVLLCVTGRTIKDPRSWFERQHTIEECVSEQESYSFARDAKDNGCIGVHRRSPRSTQLVGTHALWRHWRFKERYGAGQAAFVSDCRGSLGVGILFSCLGRGT